MILCDRCGRPIPSRFVRDRERLGVVVTGALCNECSRTGGTEVEIDVAKDGEEW